MSDEMSQSENTQWIRVDKRSWVWSHFKINKNDKAGVKCNECPAIYKHSSSTTDLIRHLASAHGIKKPGTENESWESASSGSFISSNQPGIRNAFAKVGKEPLEKVGFLANNKAYEFDIDFAISGLCPHGCEAWNILQCVSSV